MRNRERQQWTEFVQARKDEKPGKPRAKKQPQPSRAERDAMLDDLTGVAPAPERGEMP